MPLSQPATAMAVTIDIGEANDIHPRNKQDVGRRLALGALKIAYGKDIAHTGPIYKSTTREGDTVRLEFTGTGSGLMPGGNRPLTGFVVAGEDSNFVWANAHTDGNTVVLRSARVSTPIAVRYGWSDNPDCNLYNKERLPASPFRTDSWSRLTTGN